MAEQDWGNMEQQKGLLYWPYWQGKKQGGGCSIEERTYISTWSLDDAYLNGQQIFPDSRIYHAGYITLFSPCHQSGMHLAPQNRNFFLDDFSTIDASYFCLYLMLNLMYILMEVCSLGLFWSSSGFWLDLQIHSLILWSPYSCMLYKFSAIWNFNRNIAFFRAEKRLQLPLPRSDHPKYIFVWSLYKPVADRSGIYQHNVSFSFEFQ